MLITLIAFILTVALSLYALRIDAQRFFALAKELEKEEAQRTCCKNETFKKKRLFIINFSYFTLGIAIVSLSIYLGLKILNTLQVPGNYHSRQTLYLKYPTRVTGAF